MRGGGAEVRCEHALETLEIICYSIWLSTWTFHCRKYDYHGRLFKRPEHACGFAELMALDFGIKLIRNGLAFGFAMQEGNYSSLSLWSPSSIAERMSAFGT
jgi:hypothetical protein